MSGKLGWLEKHQRAASFVVAFLLFLVLNYIYDVQWFRWDAGQYWKLSALGSLLHFPVVIRGYFYPLLLAPSRFLCDMFPAWGYAPFRVISSAAYAFVLSSLLPEFYQTIFGGQVTFWRRLVVPVLLTIIYPGLIVTTLSDLPAVSLMLGAVVCGIRSVTCDGRQAARYGWLLLCGILVYGAYNTRTIFLFPALLMLLVVPLGLYRGRGRKLKLTALSVMLGGVIIAGFPQLLINVKNYGVWSPAVVTTAANKSLFARQLIWGITVQRYETTIDRSVPGPRVYYPDMAGQKLYDSLDLDIDSFTIVDYMKLLATHPVDFAGIYGRHFINGLDVRDGEAYTTSQSPSKDGLAFFNFLIVFFGLSIMLAAAFRHPPADEVDGIRWLWVCVALMPVLVIIPGAIETRFFLPLHLAFYSSIAFGADPVGIVVALKRHWLVIMLAFGMSAGVFFSITLGAMADVEYGRQRIHLPSEANTPAEPGSQD